MLVNKNNSLKWLLSATIMHEISHSIYFKSEIIKNNFDIKDKKKNLLLLEGMATSIGAGWTYKMINKKVNKSLSWYNNKKYDAMAKQIYPMMDKYLSNEKKIDNEFITFIKGNLK